MRAGGGRFPRSRFRGSGRPASSSAAPVCGQSSSAVQSAEIQWRSLFVCSFYFSGLRGITKRKLRISDNLDASGKSWDANLLHSEEFLHNPTHLAREQHSLCEVEGVWKKGILHGNCRKIYRFFSVR